MATTTLHGAVNQTPDKEKLKQLALYVAHRSENDSKFGTVKFNKILFYADFIHYVKTGCSITGYSYIKMPFGPCAVGFNDLVAEMSSNNELKIQEREHYGHTQKRPIALKIHDLTRFTGSEIATVEEVLDGLRNLSSADASELSHRFVGWELAEQYEAIPYSVARLGADYEMTNYHYAAASEVAKEVAARLNTDG